MNRCCSHATPRKRTVGVSLGVALRSRAEDDFEAWGHGLGYRFGIAGVDGGVPVLVSTPMATARRARTALLLAALCVLASGCSADALPYLDVSTPRPPAEVADPRCPRDGVGLGAGDMRRGSGPTPGTLPSTFESDRARLCRVSADPVQIPGGGLRYTVHEETSPVGPGLLHALTLPNQQFDPGDHAACAAIYHPPGYLLLIDRSNHAYRPYLPADPCGYPREEVQAALRELTASEVTTYTFDEAG